MKKITLTTLLLFVGSAIIAQTTKKVCFIGNSYTYVNDMPSLIDSIANHDGNDLIKDQNTPGGHTLDQHSTNGTSLTKISSNTWDYVVLQDQSQFPSFPYAQTSVSVYPKAEILCDSIRSANECAVPLFYNTWGREVGDSQWDSINTFSKMNNRLHIAYDFMAQENEGKLSPVGIGFRHVFDDATAIVSHGDLYSGDGSHPSIYGSYLAACIFYNVIFDASPIENTYLPNGVTTVQASYLQNVAYHVVNDVDSVETNYMDLQALFSESLNGMTAEFTNASLGGDTYFWDFGDGNTSTDENPINSYSQSGDYEVTLKVTSSNACEVITKKTLNIGSSSLKEELNNEFSVYPNPSNGQITINLNDFNQTINIFSVQGQLIDKITPTGNALILELPKGMYFIKVGSKTSKVIITD